MLGVLGQIKQDKKEQLRTLTRQSRDVDYRNKFIQEFGETA